MLRLRAAPVPGAHQQVEFAALDHLLENPEPCLLPDIEDLIHGVVRTPELGGGAVVMLAQRLQAIADGGFVVRRLGLRTGEFSKLLQHLVVALLVAPANLLQLAEASDELTVVRFVERQAHPAPRTAA